MNSTCCSGSGRCGGGVCEAHSSSPGAGAAGVSVRTSASRHTERSVSETAGGDGAQITRAGRLGRVSAIRTARREVNISLYTTNTTTHLIQTENKPSCKTTKILYTVILFS